MQSNNQYDIIKSSSWLILRAVGCTPMSSGFIGSGRGIVTFQDPLGKTVELVYDSPDGLSYYYECAAIMAWLQKHSIIPPVHDVLLAHAIEDSSRTAQETARLQREIKEVSKSLADLRAVLLGQQGGKIIRVWRFGDAPAEFRVLSKHGGSEDWLAHVPAGMAKERIPWMEVLSFGCCDVSEHELADESVVRIGAHA